MTLAEVCKQACPGLKFSRMMDARVFRFGEGKNRKPYLVVDHYDQTAALFSDDLMADDWVILYDSEPARS